MQTNTHHDAGSRAPSRCNPSGGVMAPAFVTALIMMATQCVASSGHTKPHSALFVGNSYTFYNAPHDLPGQYAELYSEALALGLAAGEQHSPETLSVTSGGYLLRMHEQDASTPGTPLHEAFKQPWEVVVLQEQSQIPAFSVKGHPEYTQSVSAFVSLDKRAQASGALTVALLTWGRRDGDAQNAWMSSFEVMQNALTQGYQGYLKAASTEDRPVRLAPAGPAFAAVKSQDAVRSAASSAALFPRLYDPDGSHPSVLGTYLAALVTVGAVTGGNVALLSWRPPGITAAEATSLRAAAMEALGQWPPPAAAADEDEAAADAGLAEVRGADADTLDATRAQTEETVSGVPDADPTSAGVEAAESPPANGCQVSSWRTSVASSAPVATFILLPLVMWLMIFSARGLRRWS